MNIHKALPVFIRSALVFFLVGFFVLMIFLTLYNHPHTDDYMAMSDVRDYGFWGYEKHIYLTWGGRFFSQYLTKIEAYQNFMLYHYYVHTCVLLAFQFISVFFLLLVVNKYIARFATHYTSIALYALCYLAVQISSLPEVASAYYWFSSASNYQPSIILIHTELACLVLYFFSGNKTAIGCAILSLLCIVLINGNNETAILINGIILTCVFALAGSRRHLWFVTCAALLYLASMLFTVTAPGNAARSANIPAAGLVKTLVITSGRTLYVFWIVLKNPLLLAGAVVVFFAGSYVRFKTSVFIVKRWMPKRHPWLILLIFPLTVWMVLLPIMYVSNGSFPERADNVVAQYIVMLLLCLLFYIGSCYTFTFNKQTLYHLLMCLLLLTLCCNRFYGELIKSCVSCKLHDVILTNREHTLMQASRSKQREVSLISYDLYADSLMNTQFCTQGEQVKTIIRQKSSVLYLYDDLAGNGSIEVLKRFYGLQKINVRQCNDH